MPKKGKKKRQELQGVPSRGPDEVQATQSSSGAASGVGPQAQTANQPPSSQPPQRVGIQDQGSSRRVGGYPWVDQQQQQGQGFQASVPAKQYGQASTGEKCVTTIPGQSPEGRGKGTPAVRIESLGRGIGLSAGRGQSPRPGLIQQDASRGQSSRPGPPQQQSSQQGASGGQNTGGKGMPEQSHLSQQAKQPIYSQPMQQADTPQVSQETETKQTLPAGPSAWGQPCAQVTPLPQVPQKPGNSAKQPPGVEIVYRALSEVPLQEKQSMPGVPLYLDNQKKAPAAPRPGPPQPQPFQQDAWAGQNAGGRGWPVLSQLPQQSARPTHSLSMPQATPQVLQQTEARKTQSSGPSAWKQPWSQATSVPQVPQTLGDSAKQAAGVDTVSKALSQVSLQEKQSTSQVLLSVDNQNKAPAKTLSIPQRKDFKTAGTLGRKIFVLTNMMRIIFDPDEFKPNVVHYDVDISPDKPKYLMKPAFNEAKVILFPKNSPAFDGKKNAYSAGPLPFGDAATATVTITNENGNKREFKVTFKKAADGDLDLSWLKNVGPGLQVTEGRQRCIQALDIILRMAPALKNIPVGRSFFTPPPEDAVMSLGGGMDCWVGHFQSAILGWKPFLNVDVAHKGFPKSQPVLDLIETICIEKLFKKQCDRPASIKLTFQLIEQCKNDINRFLKGLKVVYQIPEKPASKRIQRVNELADCPKYNRFQQNGKNVSIEDYYKSEKGYIIKHPLLHCLWIGGRDGRIHVPLELCTIVEGQATQKKLNEEQTSEMIRHAATGTEDRKRKIMEAFDRMGYNNDECMNEFGISVSGHFEEIPARVLNPPRLSYGNKDPVIVSRGQWNLKNFLESSPLIAENHTWTILNLNYYTKGTELHKFVAQLKETAAGLGVNIGMPFPFDDYVDIRSNHIQRLYDYFHLMKTKMIKLIIVIIPENKGAYGWVKQVSELKIGILTQCLKSKTLFKIKNDRYQATIKHILLKINAKLNGINHKLTLKEQDDFPSCLEEPCMIVGADVTHPSPDAKDVPSIAAVVASHDRRALFQYNAEIRLQPPKEEIILQLAEIMKIQLDYFYEKTKHWPHIFYRDGVGEGHFPKVLQRELLAIRTACKAVEHKVGYEYQPKITFLVVQKRHHTRFFPTNPKDSDDARKGFNVKAGTVVDTEITHPTDIDFYLCSHASIQGTARPTKYRLLWDDADMSQDDIEQLTYYLCHLFSRCTRSVSYPTPTYYAHLAAFRARALTQDVPINLENLDNEQRLKLTLKEEIRKNYPMFFV